jgi:hypothetical protein
MATFGKMVTQVPGFRRFQIFELRIAVESVLSVELTGVRVSNCPSKPTLQLAGTNE